MVTKHLVADPARVKVVRHGQRATKRIAVRIKVGANED